MAQYAVPQRPAVVRNELTGKNDVPRQSGLVAFPQQPCELGREPCGGAVVHPAGRLVDDSCLGGIGEDKAHIRIMGRAEKGVILLKHVHRPADTTHYPALIHRLPVAPPPQAELVEPLLIVDAAGLSGRGGGNHHYLTLKVCTLVHHVNEMFCESPQKVSFTELEYPLRGLPQQVSVISPLFQRRISETFHKNPPYYPDVPYDNIGTSVCKELHH